MHVPDHWSNRTLGTDLSLILYFLASTSSPLALGTGLHCSGFGSSRRNLNHVKMCSRDGEKGN
jgi:hypothetical protein